MRLVAERGGRRVTKLANMNSHGRWLEWLRESSSPALPAISAAFSRDTSRQVRLRLMYHRTPLAAAISRRPTCGPIQADLA